MTDDRKAACGGAIPPQVLEGFTMEMSYFKLFFDWSAVTRKLTDEEKGRLIDAVVRYAESGDLSEAENGMTGNEAFVFPHYQTQVDRDRDALDALTQTRSEAGKKGGRPKKQKNQMLFEESKKSYEKEEEKEEENEEVKKESKRKKVIAFEEIQAADRYFPESDRLEQGLREWLAYKAERRESYKPRSVKMLVNKMRELSKQYGEDAVLGCIEQSMLSNWQGLWFDKIGEQQGRKERGSWNFSDFRRDNYNS